MQSVIEAINASKEIKFEDYFKKYPILHGLVMEFGVAEGHTINQIADFLPDRTIWGFDSFEGNPEEWNGNPIGAFKVENYRKIEYRDNVTIMPGLFETKIPNFFKFHKREKVALIHIDCDLYSSTKTVFDNLKNRFQNGSIIIFDELYGYGGEKESWKEHEYKAFNEFLHETQYKWECLGRHGHEHAGFRIWKDWEFEHK